MGTSFNGRTAVLQAADFSSILSVSTSAGQHERSCASPLTRTMLVRIQLRQRRARDETVDEIASKAIAGDGVVVRLHPRAPIRGYAAYPAPSREWGNRQTRRSQKPPP